MPLAVHCTGCGAQFGAPDSLAGKSVKCPQCKTTIKVEGPSTAPKAAKPAPKPQAAKPQTAKPRSQRPAGAGTAAAKQASRPKAAPTASRAQAPQQRRAPAKPAAPAAKAPVANDPLDLDELSQMEAGQDPLGLGTTAPGNQPAARPVTRPQTQWQNPAAKQTSSSKMPLFLLLGLGGGGIALLLVVAIIVVAVVALSSGDDDPEIAGDVGIPNAVEFDPNLQPMAATTGSGGGTNTSTSTPSPSTNGTRIPGFDERYSGNGFGGQNPPAGGAFGDPADNSETNATDNATGEDNGDSSGSPFAPTGGSSSTGRRPSLVKTTLDWHGSGTKLAGRHKVEDMDLVIYHYSWMTRLLPELGYQEVYDKFDFKETFIKGENALLCRLVIPEFLNPMDGRDRFKGRYFEEMGLSHFVGMSGYAPTRNTLAAALPRSDENAGVFGYDEVAAPSEITDGLSSTIMIIGTGMIAGPWVAGGGNTIKHGQEPFFDKVTGFGSKGLDRTGAIVMMADGSVRHIYDDVDDEVFKALCTIHGGENVDVSAAGESAEDWNSLPMVKSENEEE